MYSYYLLENIIYVLFGLFLLVSSIQVFYYLRVFITPFLGKKSEKITSKQPVSVIICVKNEADNLRKHLPAILTQEFHEYEVIIVNDCSTDDTDTVIAEFMKKHDNLRTTSIMPNEKFSHGKKLAVTVGIKAAKYEWLVFVDADCFPVSNKWLSSIHSNFNKKEIVLGYGGYEHKKGLLNLYLRYDTVFIAFQYLGFAQVGQPYMGVGRNMSYKKSLFFKNKGFASHYDLFSGDDDLFINETATASNTAVEVTKESFTRSVPKQTWGEWFTQKIRHFTTANRYKAKHIFMLGLEPFTRLAFYLLLVLLLVAEFNNQIVLGVIGVRFLLQIWLGILAKTKFEEKGLYFMIPIFDVVSIFMNFVLYCISRIRVRKLRWK